MTNALDTATEHLLAPGSLDESAISRILDTILTRQVDLADLYFQSTRSESWVLEDGIVKEGSHNIGQGVGVRAVSGEKTGFAYSDELALPALLAATAGPFRGGEAREMGADQAWGATEVSIVTSRVTSCVASYVTSYSYVRGVVRGVV